jgi:hypothetical protein
MIQSLNIDELKVSLKEHYVTYLKYVKVNGEYRFHFAAEWNSPKHSQMVTPEEKEKVESAAYCKVYPHTDGKRGRIEVEDYSTSLGIGSAQNDEKEIEKLLL